MPTEIDKVEQAKCRIAYPTSGIEGCWMAVLAHPDWPTPICTVWYRFVGNKTIEILGSYTIEAVRRMGARTEVHKRMIEDHHHVRRFLTMKGTKESRKWMHKMGYTRDKLTDDWVLEVNKPKPKRRKKKEADAKEGNRL